MGFWVGSGISWTICKQSAPRSRQITTATPHHLFFYRPDALPDAQPTPLWTRCWFLCTKCSKTRLRASLVPKVSRGLYPAPPLKGKGGGLRHGCWGTDAPGCKQKCMISVKKLRWSFVKGNSEQVVKVDNQCVMVKIFEFHHSWDKPLEGRTIIMGISEFP